MALEVRTPVRRGDWAGRPGGDVTGYVAPPGHMGTVRWDFDHGAGELVEIRSATPPDPEQDWVLVWWPGGKWRWEHERNLVVVDAPRRDTP